MRNIDNADIGKALRELPQQAPPAEAMAAVFERAQHEQLIATPTRWPYALAAGVATLALAVGLVRTQSAEPDMQMQVVQTTPEIDSLDNLINRSVQLDALLIDLPERPKVQRVSTAGTITELEDRVSLIDMQLNEGELVSRDQRQVLWRERVNLMDTLVRIRYAQSEVMWL